MTTLKRFDKNRSSAFGKSDASVNKATMVPRVQSICWLWNSAMLEAETANNDPKFREFNPNS
jgi:hypothetical protein